MRPRGDGLLKQWHKWLGLPRQSPPSWYRDRLLEELRERRLAKTPLQKLSETSDVFFSRSRAQYDGFPVRKLPLFVTSRHALVYGYMLAKYTLRWKFYRTAAVICKVPHYDLVREVVNPSKDHKLDEVALRHQVDPVEFKRVGRRLRQSESQNYNWDNLEVAGKNFDAHFSVSYYIRLVAALCCTVCLIRSLFAPPDFTREAGCISWRQVASGRKVLQHFDYFIELMIASVPQATRSPTKEKATQSPTEIFLSTLARKVRKLSHTPIDYENVSSNMSSSMAELQFDQPATPKIRYAPDHNKAVVVGLYGVPGSGKSFLLNKLKQELGKKHFAFFEGSEMIATVVPGGLDAFQAMKEQEKAKWRSYAIDAIGKECADSKQVAVVTGHFMFWSEGQEIGTLVYTRNDLKIFTHILYLDIAAEVVAQRCLDNTERSRPSISATHLRKWQREEMTRLRCLCYGHGILFMLVDPTLPSQISIMLEDFKHHNEDYNLAQAKSRLSDVLIASRKQMDTVWIMDGDKTLAPEDTGMLFWQKVSESRPLECEASKLKTLFSSPLGYSYAAFRQAVLLYEETANDEDFDGLCQDVASEVNMRAEFISLLQIMTEQTHVGAVVVTCGLRRVWEKVLEREGLAEKVKVIGGGRIADGFIVSAAVKGALACHLRKNGMYVWAFGDSPLDLDMLRSADRAIVVVGEEQDRSKTMDAALKNAMYYYDLRACQAMLPSCASPRLDVDKLPVIKLTEPETVESLLRGRYTHGSLKALHATDRNAAKLLATPMRDATIAGPDLRGAHRRVGWYLAFNFLTDVLGLEQRPIQHVLGHQTKGYQFSHEQQTTIIALMRGGEPMASGVSDAFPRAMFVHASDADDIKPHHLHGQLTVLLVDSVVNTGKTIVQFVQHIRTLHASVRIVVVAGTVQAQCMAGANLPKTLSRYANLRFVALRFSDTKFTGSGSTDTGNRLFNTTHLP